MIEALSGGWADSKILQTHGKRMINKDFTPKGKTTTQLDPVGGSENFQGGSENIHG